MADAEDLKSSGDFSSCGFDSHPGHQNLQCLCRERGETKNLAFFIAQEEGYFGLSWTDQNWIRLLMPLTTAMLLPVQFQGQIGHLAFLARLHNMLLFFLELRPPHKCSQLIAGCEIVRCSLHIIFKERRFRETELHHHKFGTTNLSSPLGLCSNLLSGINLTLDGAASAREQSRQG